MSEPTKEPISDRLVNGIIVGAALVFVISMAAMVFGPSYLRDRETTRLQTEGVLAEARVVTFRDTGNRFNSVPEIVTTVDILQEGKETYRANIRSIGYGNPKGTMLWVRVDPADPQNVVYQITEPEITQ